MPVLSVNIDHVATVREARKTYEPDPVWAAALAQLGGADGITLHLREDRRHIQERDLRLLKETTSARLNLELACETDVLAIACDVKPEQVTLVPERRDEITTEGGLDVIAHHEPVERAIAELRSAGMFVSLFLDPEPAQIEAAKQLEAEAVELHTGQYALASGAARTQELSRLIAAGAAVRVMGMQLHAGHGLDYQNVQPVAAIPEMHELNIGHSIVSRSIMVGMQAAVREMKNLMQVDRA